MKLFLRILALCLVLGLVATGPAAAGVVSLNGFVAYKDRLAAPGPEDSGLQLDLAKAPASLDLIPTPNPTQRWLEEFQTVAREEEKGILWPVAFTAGPLGEGMGASHGPAPDHAYTPMFLDEATDGINPYGGYLAMAWRLGPLGLTLGGGYARAQSEVTGGSTGSSRRWRMSRSYSSQNGNTVDQSQGRWAAFASVPYQITDRFGLAPEVSYYYADMPDKVGQASDEWVLGLQFRFGF